MSASAIGKIIFTQEQIQQRVVEIGQEINRDYQGKDLIIVGILKGSLYFMADLTRQLIIPLQIDFLSIGVGGEESNQNKVSIKKDLETNIASRHVLLVEDVIGTGLTLGYICQHLSSAKPASLKICSLLDNPVGRLLNIDIAYRCFFMPDVYVVGYGLDYKENYRNLPYIAEYQRKRQL